MVLPLLGKLAYNNIEFGATSRVTASTTPVMDATGRIVSYLAVTFRVETEIPTRKNAATTGQETEPQEMRYRLSEAGKNFIIRNRGFGYNLDLNNNSGGQQDVRWGPTPRVIEWEPIGYSNAFSLVWEVTVNLSPDDAYLNTAGLMEFNYECAYDIDESGFTSRTVNGHITIASKYDNTGLLVESAEKWSSIITKIKQPRGYKRRASHSISADKTRMDFSILDYQIKSKNVYPPFIANLRVLHHAQQKLQTLASIQNSININLEYTPDVPYIGYGWHICNTIASSRMSKAQGYSISGDSSVIVDQVDVEEDVYGFGMSYNIQYRVLQQFGILIDLVGMFEPILEFGFDWNVWTDQIHRLVRGGVSDLHDMSNQDELFNLGQTPQSPIDLPYLFDYQDKEKISYQKQAPVFYFKNPTPSPRKSYYHFKAKVTKSKKQDPVEQVPRNVADPNAPGDKPPDKAKPPRRKRIRIDFPSKGSVSTIERTNAMGYRIAFEGSAIRIGYPIPEPDLDINQSADFELVRASRVFEQQFAGNLFGVPVYAATWKMDYVVDNEIEGDDYNDAYAVDKMPYNESNIG